MTTDTAVKNINKVTLQGRLTFEPDTYTMKNGGMMLKFNIATNQVFVGKDGVEKELTDFHKVTLFNSEIAESLMRDGLQKGSIVRVEGSNNSGSYEKEGKKVYTYGVKAIKVDLVEAGKRLSSEEEMHDF